MAGRGHCEACFVGRGNLILPATNDLRPTTNWAGGALEISGIFWKNAFAGLEPLYNVRNQ
jgi:hypothetical protein